MTKKVLNEVFVYGSLKDGEWNDRPFYRDQRLACRKGTIHGRIYAVASYPGVRLNDEESLVHGEVHTYPAENMTQILEMMDALEGYQEGRKNNFYNRRIVTVTLENGEEVQAYVYEYGHQPPEDIRIESGIWTVSSREELFAKARKTFTIGR